MNLSKSKNMQGYEAYVAELSMLANRLRTEGNRAGLAQSVDASLDGQPGRRLRELVSVGDLRASGAFFTGSELATFAASKFVTPITESSVVLDPACGAGDLLVTCAKALPVAGTLGATLQRWGRQLMGGDLHSEFVAAAQLRLAILALSRGSKGSPAKLPDLQRLLPEIRVGCGQAQKDHAESATHVFMNPPFTSVEAPRGCLWRKGQVNEAAIFVDKVIHSAQAGTSIVAILPDVLRSGQGYRKWRDLVDTQCATQSIDLWGRFARWADVDVFVWSATKRASRTRDKSRSAMSWSPTTSSALSVGDQCSVSVGPVVPFRDPNRGGWAKYLHPGNAPAWGEVFEVSESKRTRVRLAQPPFVVVRRTSRPGDKHRAVGTIVRGSRAVAVENHLLILDPVSKTVRDCRMLLKSLRDTRTTSWLDRRIRCRHLTVSALRALPLWENEK